MIINESEFGVEISYENFLVFFGQSDSQFNAVRMKYNDFHFTRLKQVHGNKIVQSGEHDDLRSEADAHFSDSLNHGLCSITADCAPILIAVHSAKPKVCAIHAGWRGVAGKIISESIQNLIKSGDKIEDMSFFIGPHIQKQSFEVHNDVAGQILSSIKDSQTEKYQKKIGTDKAHVDLQKVIRQQLAECGVEESMYFYLKEDTYTNRKYNSFRRDKGAAGRQTNFIVRLA